ncbi:DUF2628 domain-containing protein [Devosia sp. PTR5]|uniref:DUF2628 domain-containing protein n=1 Tax=Devosia oryzisoli TaxID=2774138 RepID=A0A927FUD6_9HYPH|nr:DUF2628 domain-containing protein [Devosia oryzisoli]MBD8066470.1 DUF2628 domain-containing protein [Devosia oryzisoli]
MTLYAILKPAPGSALLPEAVADKFSWFAFFLPPIHALVHGLWGQLVVVVIGLIAVFAAGWFAGGEAAFWLYVLLAVSAGFATPGSQRRTLRRRGYTLTGYRVASDPDLARLDAMEARA